ncbi:hypothetical protein [Mycolicibacterium sarraceniae]|uniref:hypothetical protein n=1 Tax=Mycolicibacterium sarraceniae TaxID=1534348 RepID=UPI0013D10146|nr:hypothetical protein [Mycolicibacterium sarraceniae]
MARRRGCRPTPTQQRRDAIDAKVKALGYCDVVTMMVIGARTPEQILQAADLI